MHPSLLLQELHRWDRVLKSDPHNVKAYVWRGMSQFKLGNIVDSIQDFDRAEALDPQITPYLWQRGLSYYYANRFAEGIRQFEIDLSVNAQDVEETVWRYLCMAQLQDAETAQKALLCVRNDRRRIMRFIYELFAGNLTPAQVLAKGSQEGNSGEFYSLLYVALYYEAVQNMEQAQIYMGKAVQAVQTQYSSGDYMAHLAIVHQRLRGWGSMV